MDNQITKPYTDKTLAITSLAVVFTSVAGLAIYSSESIQLAAKWMQWTTSVFTTPVLLFALGLRKLSILKSMVTSLYESKK